MKAAPKVGRPHVDFHKLRQVIFEHSLLMMEAFLGRKGSVIDLGAGHCKFALMAHAMGWQATAFDARTARKPEPPNEIPFIQGDVDSDAWNPSDYDVILCLGLHYHLDQEMQHRFFERCRGKPLILDTTFSLPVGQPTRFARDLSPTYEKNGEIGADFREAGTLDDQKRKDTSLLASFENQASWWPTKESLVSVLHDYGWPHVWVLDHHQMDFIQRTFFVCYAADEQGPGVTGIRF